jgi:hypothetical protein
MVDEAITIARASGNATALRVALETKLHLIGGPAQPSAARALVTEVQQLASQHRRIAPVAPIMLALHEALLALQRGEPVAALASLDAALALGRELRHGELSWHAERARVLVAAQFGKGPFDAARMQVLHRRAEQRPIISTAAYCAFDRLVSVPALTHDTSAVVADDETRTALSLDGSEPPSVWALKVRALAATDLTGAARAALRRVAPAELSSLPCDTGYLGTLGHLARAALRLGERAHIEALHALLARYPTHFAVQESYLSEGPVPHLLGLLDAALGREAAAQEHLEAGRAMSERAGFSAGVG